MGFDLYTQKSTISFNDFGWITICLFAEYYGWQPMGTQTPDPAIWPKELLKRLPELGQDWDGAYDVSNFQEVTAIDAKNMADALRAGIEEIRDGEHDAELMDLHLPSEIIEYLVFVPSKEQLREDIIRLSNSFIEFSKDAPFLIG